ncbi:hypothetical protein PspLS_01341, partial [Pyricularia sp. CBS 133598]
TLEFGPSARSQPGTVRWHLLLLGTIGRSTPRVTPYLAKLAFPCCVVLSCLLSNTRGRGLGTGHQIRYSTKSSWHLPQSTSNNSHFQSTYYLKTQAHYLLRCIVKSSTNYRLLISEATRITRTPTIVH